MVSSRSWCGQFSSQVWKNILVKIRSPIKLILELLFPILLLFAVVGIKTTTESEREPGVNYASESMRTPSTRDLLTLPMMNSSEYSLGSWYILYGGKFLSHGSSNFAYTCEVNTEDFNFEITNFNQICQQLQFVVIPEDKSNNKLVERAERFKSFWINKYPELVSQNRFDLGENKIEDNDQLESYIQASDYGTRSRPPLGVAIVFRSAAEEDDWSYWIRVNKTAAYGGQPKPNIPLTRTSSRKTDDLERGETSYSDQYLISGFTSVQKEVDSFIFQQVTGRNAILETNSFAMPTRAFNKDPFWSSVADTFALILLLAMLYPLAMVIQLLVRDKEYKIRELMFMMGLRPSVYTLSWLFLYTIFYIILGAILTGIAKINLFELAEGSVIFVYFLLFGLSTMSFGFFIASLFERTNVATIVGLLVYFIGYFLYIGLNSEGMGVGVQIFVSLIPSTAFSFGTVPFSEYEGSLVPLTWDNVGISNTGDYTMATCLVMLFFDTIFYILFSIYFDNVLPSSTGAARRKWHFPFSELCCSCFSKQKKFDSSDQNYVDLVKKQTEIEEELVRNSNGYYEPVSESLKNLREQGKCVMIQGLQKTFKTDNGVVQAVNDLSLTIFEGQITVLLGSNGAGKSTTISQLCGLIPPTSGEAFIDGLSITRNMKDIRHNIGVCPQSNVLFPDLTVREHLDVFAGIKGIENKKQAIIEMIAQVGLTPKTNVRSKNLSGGMKRKLQLAIALLGDSKLIICDEPTSGVDPYSRSLLWQTILKYRESRTILLTTHFMDEADLLGDRIAIMASGKLSCVGTSLFLKKKFGVGYQLTVETDANKSIPENITASVQKFVQEAKVVSEAGSELILQLPLGAASSFPDMLKELEDHKEELSILEVGISVTTLEAVFLRIALGGKDFASTAAYRSSSSTHIKNITKTRENDEDNTELLLEDNNGLDDEIAKTEDVAIKIIKQDEGFYSPKTSVHISSMLLKRLRYAKRDRRAWCCQLIIPIIFLLLGFILMKASAQNEPQPYYFDAQTNDWNTNPENPNPVAFNSGLEGSISDQATTDLMNDIILPRIERNQKFVVGGTETYCMTASYAEKLAQQASVVLGIGNVIQNVLLLELARSNLPICVANSMYNASSFKFSEALSATINESPGSRYTSLIFDILTSSSNKTFQAEYTVVYNFTGVHSLPLSINRVNNGLLVQHLDNKNVKIQAASYAFPRTQAELDIGRGFTAFSATLAIGIAFAFVPSSFAVFIVREKEQKSYHQQLINGIQPLAYWASNWIFDFLTYMIPMLVAWVFIPIFDLTVFKDEFGAVALIFLLYGISITSFTYCLSFSFSSYTFAQFGMIGINILGGMILLVVAFVMSVIDSTYEVNDSLIMIYSLLPSFSFAYGLLQVANLQFLNTFLNSRQRGGDPTNPVDYGVWDMKIAGTQIVYLALESIIYTLLLVFLQINFRSGYCCRGDISFNPKTKSHENLQKEENNVEDEDVEKERLRIKQLGGVESNNCDDTVVLEDVRKIFYGLKVEKVAVKQLSLGIKKHECFGFLGTNGAGKTTSLSMCTGELKPTNGKIFISGIDMVNSTSQAQQKIGYCPQFDALFDLLTGREHLEYYARIRGIPKTKVNNLVDEKLKELGLEKHADNLAGAYSGGNKRKLSVAIATISAQVVFLDEPSSGMDPLARRFLWGVISDLTKRSSVVITTHSMEECEALSNRIGIMVDGRLRCLGTAQHLKTKYGRGYQLEINLKVPEETDLTEIANELKLQDLSELLNEEQVKACLSNIECPDLFEKEFTIKGSATLLKQQLDFGKSKITVRSLTDWLKTFRNYQNLTNLLEKHFTGYELIERQGLRIRFGLPHIEGLNLHEMFSIIENAKEHVGIEGYSLGQTTLESIFNTFAATQSQNEN